MTDPDPIRELIEAAKAVLADGFIITGQTLERLDAAIAAIEEDQAILDSWSKARRPERAEP